MQTQAQGWGRTVDTRWSYITADLIGGNLVDSRVCNPIAAQEAILERFVHVSCWVCGFLSSMQKKVFNFPEYFLCILSTKDDEYCWS